MSAKPAIINSVLVMSEKRKKELYFLQRLIKIKTNKSAIN